MKAKNMLVGGSWRAVAETSGFGREGVRYAMEEMSETRLVVINS